MEVPDDPVWYVGVTISTADAEKQLLTEPGPHRGGAYNESDARGNPRLLPLVNAKSSGKDSLDATPSDRTDSQQ